MDEPTPDSTSEQLAARLGGLARDASESAYQPPQLDALWLEIEHKTTRRRPSWALVAAACAACLITGGVVSWIVSQGVQDPMSSQGPMANATATMVAQPFEAPALHDGRIELPDGSLALALDDASDLSWTRDASGITVTLSSGAAVFDVAAQPEGESFRVRAGDAEVEVIGTRFTVRHVDNGVDVEVALGRVAVYAPSRQAVLLGAGESAHVGPHALVAQAGQGAEDRDEATPGVEPGPRPRSLPAEPEDSEQAPEVPPAAAVKAPSVDALLDRADAARKKGDHKAAATALQTVLDDHPKDPQAALAAYTLGRIQLSDLDRPQQAAKAFAKARALAPKGTMAEDALAKEIESWGAAKRQSRARDAAVLYLDRYPAGRWTKLAQRYAAP